MGVWMSELSGEQEKRAFNDGRVIGRERERCDVSLINVFHPPSP